MSEDPIEELFRQRSEESASEKPRDLVWKRIETGLQNQDKKKKPLKEFISSVWFSAAVFALIAIPYFILFVMNINQGNASLIEIVKTENPFIKETINTNKQIEVIEMKDLEDQPASSIVKNDEVNKFSRQLKNDELVPVNSENEKELNFNERLTPDIALLKTQTLDSIEHNDQLALNSKLRKFSSNDSVTVKSNAPVVIRGAASLRTNKIDGIVTESGEAVEQQKTNSIVNGLSGSVSGLAISTDKKIVNNSDNIIYKPLKFVAKTDILRTSFRLEKKSNHKISFVNKTVTISFEKSGDKIILKTNEPKMNPNLVNLLEKNKKEIYTYYQK